MRLLPKKIVLTTVIMLLTFSVFLMGCGKSNSATNQGVTPAETAAPETSTPVDSTESQWDKYLTAAKTEGSVTVVGAQSPEFRDKATKIMKEQYGIQLDYLTLSSSEAIARVKREVQAGKLSIDVQVSGGSEMVEYHDWLLPLEDKLVMPEVADKNNWRLGELLFADDEKTNLQISQYVSKILWVNTDLIQNGSFKAEDLLKPEYKGKIAAFDPRGPGQGRYAAIYLLNTLGEDFVKELYTKQDVVISADARQLADWLASGNYPIAIALLARDVEPFASKGLPIEPALAEDALGYSNGKLVKILKDAPHPNAAIVFVNWLASKEGMELYSKSFYDASLRSDVSREGLPEFIFPVDGVDYPSFSQEEVVKEGIPKAQELLFSILGR